MVSWELDEVDIDQLKQVFSDNYGSIAAGSKDNVEKKDVNPFLASGHEVNDKSIDSISSQLSRKYDSNKGKFGRILKQYLGMPYSGKEKSEYK
jgi:hypothetical protein